MATAALKNRFVHLHLHSEYSLLDGGNRLDKLVARVKALGMDAVAVTDHGNMHAAVSFYEKARAEGIKPILGVEAYVAAGSRTDKTYTGVADGGYHLVMLAENNAGWQNLLYLCSEAYLTGFYFKPRMDREILEKHSDGIIVINGHLGSEIAHHLLRYEETKDKAHWKAAVEAAEWHRRVFAPTETGPRFYVELQHHVREQIAINPHLIRLARELDLPLVCDNDSHFLLAEDHDAHDTLICISTGKVKDDPARMRYTPELYVKSPEEMWAIFGGPEYNNEKYGDAGIESLENTVRIAERCRVELPVGANHAPVVKVFSPGEDELPRPEEFGGDLTGWFKAYCAKFELAPFDETKDTADPAELKERCDRALRMLAEAGMVWRYGPEILEYRHGETDAARAGRPGAEGEGARKHRELQVARWARLNRELQILADKLISAYFLIVWDFVNWGRQQGIPANARGSGVGTMVGYVLGLSNACPVEYGLLFERFTDPDRTEYPDIDIDLCQDGRGAVIDYVRRKYGYVAQIITFGTLGAKAAIRDVARVHGMPLPEADRLAKLIPEELKITIDKALDKEPDLRALYDRDPAVKRVIDNARRLEGQARHSSVHAAGVIVATKPLYEVCPLYKQSGAGEHEVVTQWDGPTCEKMGLLKMDFLGLRTLSVIERAKKLIREGLGEREIWEAVGRGEEFERREAQKRGGGSAERPGGVVETYAHPLDLDRLDYRDQTVFELFRRGDTTGVFQFESGGMRRLLVEMRPDRLGDLIAANALFRPGPMDLIPDYNQRKHGQQEVPKVHPIVEKFTDETYGIMVYQEQVMQIVHELGGIPLRQAYTLIKAISKKKEKIINQNRGEFVEGAAKQGLAREKAEELFDLILKFAGYGFNKSHSTGYAIVAYQTAYLKTYFPNQYMAAFLTYESQAQKVADWIPYLDDCRRTRFVDPRTGAVVKTGVEVRPPDVNLSDAEFSVVFAQGEPRTSRNGHVRFGLRAIKGAGAKAIEAIIAEREGAAADGASGRERRPYKSIFDFCERVPSTACNKATIEALVKSGCFDSVHGRDARASVVATIEAAVAAGQKIAQDKASGQEQLFGFGGGDGPAASAPAEAAGTLVKVDPWSEAETLKQEKETLGFYVSSHPLEQWGAWARCFTQVTVPGLKDVGQDVRVMVPAMVQSVRPIVVRNGKTAGQKMAILTIEDKEGTADAVMFATVYQQFGHLLEEDEPKFFEGRVDHSRGDPQLIIDRLVPIDGVPKEKGKLVVFVREPVLNGKSSAGLRAIVETARSVPKEIAGQRREAYAFDLVVETEDRWITLQPSEQLRLAMAPETIKMLTDALGEGSVCLFGGQSVELQRDDRKRWGDRGKKRAAADDDE